MAHALTVIVFEGEEAVLTGSEAGVVRRHPIVGGQLGPAEVMVEAEGPITAILVHEGRRQVVVGDNLVCLESGVQTKLPEAPHRVGARGDFVLIGGSKAHLLRWEDDALVGVRSYDPAGAIADLDVSADGARVLLVTSGDRITTYAEGETLGSFTRKAWSEVGARLGPTAPWLYFGGQGRYHLSKVKPNGHSLVKLDAHGARNPPAASCPEGRYLAAIIGSPEGEGVQLFDLAHDRALFYMPGEGAVSAVALSRGARFLGVARGEALALVEPRAGIQPAGRGRIVHSAEIRAVGQASDLLVMSRSGRVVCVDPQTGGVQPHGALPEAAEALHWKPAQLHEVDGDLVLCGEGEAAVAFDPVSGEVRWRAPWMGEGARMGEHLFGHADARSLAGLDLRSGERSRLELRLDEQTCLNDRIPPLAAGSRLLVMTRMQHSGDRLFEQHDLVGRRLRLGPGHWANAAPGLHVVTQPTPWSWVIWARGRPVLERAEQEGARPVGLVTPSAGLERVFAAEDHTLSIVVYDGEGRLLGHLRGHGARLLGLLPGPAGRSLLSWDRAGVVRWWDLSELPMGAGPAVATEPLDWRPWKPPVDAPVEPPAVPILETIAQHQDDWALQRYAWRLPDEVDEAVDAALTARLGTWRPRFEAKGRKVNAWVQLAKADPSGAAWGMWACGYEGAAGLELLIRMLSDPEGRARATQALTALGPFAAAAIPALVEGLDATDEHHRGGCKQALQAVRPIDSARLQRALRFKRAASRNEALAVLHSYGAAAVGALPGLIEATRDKRSKGVRSGACGVLMNIGPPAAEAVPALLVCCTDKASEVRRAAFRALGAIGDRSPEVVAALQLGLSDPESGVYRGAALGLGHLGVVEACEAVLARPRDSAEMGEALLRLGSQEGMEALFAQLRRPESWARSVAAEALTRVGTLARHAASRVAELLAQEPDWYVASCLCDALAAMGDPAVCGAIEAVARSSEEVAGRASAVEALGVLGASVEAWLTEDSARVRMAAIEGAWLQGEREALLSPLLRLVEAGEYAVAERLEELGDPAALPTLRAALEGANPHRAYPLAEAIRVIEGRGRFVPQRS